MSEPTTYALPDEPEGPVWDKDGERWERDTRLGGWDLVAGYLSRTWPILLTNYGPLTSTPPWKPEVGGIVETIEQYAALPVGSIVSRSSTNPYVRGSRSDGDYWFGIGCDDKFGHLYMARISRTILRVGWES